MARTRRPHGSETWSRLLEWDRGSGPAERLASAILLSDGFASLDPSHPLGGRDGGADIRCVRNGVPFTVAVYFPRGKKTFTAIRKKYCDDVAKIPSGHGFVFVSNQEVTVSQREKLKLDAAGRKIEIYHLERINGLLNDPSRYGIRLEFLQIPMSTSEQVAYFATRDKQFASLQSGFEALVETIQQRDGVTLNSDALQPSVPLQELKEFQTRLEQIAGGNPYSFGGHWLPSMTGSKTMNDLKVPLEELLAFQRLLNQICGTTSLWETSLTYIGESMGALPQHFSQGAKLSDLKNELKAIQELVNDLCRKTSPHDVAYRPNKAFDDMHHYVVQVSKEVEQLQKNIGVLVDDPSSFLQKPFGAKTLGDVKRELDVITQTASDLKELIGTIQMPRGNPMI